MINDFAHAARNAITAGFDGVDCRAPTAICCTSSCRPTPTSATIAGAAQSTSRIRLTVEVARAVAEAIGAHRVGLRISPTNPLNDIVEDGYRDIYQALVDALTPIGLA